MSEADRQLVRQLLTGDPASARQFVDEWQPRIAGWIARFCSPGAVEDYAQEVLWHLAQDGWGRLGSWRGLDAERSNPNSLAAYIKKITILKTIDLLRADRRQLPNSGEPFDIVDETGLLGMDPMESAEGRSLMAAIMACFDDVERRDQHLLIMWRQGRPDRHSARILGMTANNVRQRRHYVLKRLRLCLIAKLPGYFSDF